MLKQYPESVKVVFKNFPLKSHRFAEEAAAAALAAGKQGKFWEFHDELHKHYRNLNDKKIHEIAEQLGLNKEQFEKDLKDPAIHKRIQEDYEEGQEIEIRGVPTVFINGRRIESRDLGNIQGIVEERLKQMNKQKN